MAATPEKEGSLLRFFTGKNLKEAESEPPSVLSQWNSYVESQSQGPSKKTDDAVDVEAQQQQGGSLTSTALDVRARPPRTKNVLFARNFQTFDGESTVLQVLEPEACSLLQPQSLRLSSFRCFCCCSELRLCVLMPSPLLRTCAV